MSAAFEVRFLTGADAGKWSRLRLEALQGDPEAFSSSAEEHQALSLEEVRERLSGGGGDSFVAGAFAESHLIGMAGFYRQQGPKLRHKGRIWGVYVTPARRGQGIGRRILQALLQRAAGISGLEQILLSVTQEQQAAIRLYGSLGFESFGCEPRAVRVGERYFDEEHMVLRLPHALAPVQAGSMQ